MTIRPVSVVGGGIAGLAAAFELQRSGRAVHLFDPGPLGGKIQSSLVGDELVDAGPDSVLARRPEAVGLIAELGLTNQLVSPVSTVPAYFYHQGQRAELPSGTILGIPTDFDAIAQSGLVSADGLSRAKQDITQPGPPIADDISLGQLCRERLGDEVTERLIDPLLGGINASNIDELSLNAAFPALAAVAKPGGSLIENLRRRKPKVGPTLGSGANAPVFYSLNGGLATMVDRLVDTLVHPPEGPPTTLHQQEVTRLDELPSSDVILATPTATTAELIAPLAPDAAAGLRSFRSTDVHQVTFAFAADAVGPMNASGVLIGRDTTMLATAATWLSTKWAHYQTKHANTSSNRVLIRVTSGRADDRRASTLKDEALAHQLFSDLTKIVEVTAAPLQQRVCRWPSALPHYRVGHIRNVQQIRSAVAATYEHKLTLAGAGYDGLGIPACIGSGRRAARRLIGTHG